MNIAIAGAGIMGRMLAWKLVEQGHQISLFDKDPIEQGSAAAYAAAGMLTPYCELESAEPDVYNMGMRALEIWPSLLKPLQSDLGFQQVGSLVVAHNSDRVDQQRFDALLERKLPQDEKFLKLNQVQLKEVEPELAENFRSATFLPKEGQVCSKCVMRSLADALLDKRIAWHSSTEVTELGQGYLVARKKRYEFDQVIDCRGLGAKADINNLRGVRGELIWLQAPEVKIKHLVRLMHPRYRIYVVPRKDDIYLIGATQIESDDMSEISVRSSLELLSAAYSLHSGFAEARVIKTVANCRPALPDNQPKVLVSEGLIQINGLFRHGFLLAPTIAEEVVDWLATGGSHQSEYPNLFESLV